MKKKKLLSMLFILILVQSVFFSCTAKKSVRTETTSVPSTASESVDYGGDEFVILSHDTTETYNGFPYAEIFAEEQNGDTLNDAVYDRNLAIEEKYNVQLISKTGKNPKEIVDLSKKAILAGDSLYDVIFPTINGAFSLATSQLVQNLETVPHVDFSRPWWMSNLMKSTSIAGKTYFASCDSNIGALNTIGITYFNKRLLSKYNLENPYDLVDSGRWTLEKMAEMGRTITQDVDGNGDMDEKDNYGLVCSNFAWQPLFYGTGNLLIKKDADDIPYLDATSEKNYNAISKVISLIDDKTVTFNVNHSSGFSDLGALTVETFRSGKALFFIELIYGVPEFRDMKDDFGILPLPKYDETQEKYSSYIHTGKASTLVVPITNTDLDKTGRIMEDMAYQSYIKIRPAFYDVMLKTKYARDEKTTKMLDIILENVTVDFTLIMLDYGLDIDTKLRTAAGTGSTDILSTIAAKESAYKDTIEKATNAFMK